MRQEGMMRRWLRWWIDRVIHRGVVERQLEEEIETHLALEARERIEAGEPPEQAWATARRQLGGVLRTREATRELWAFTSFERLWQDLRYASRGLRRSPGFTVVATGALALGIGATTAMFTIVSTVILRPLPYADPARLVMVWERTPNSDRPNVVSMPNFRAWLERSRSFERMAAYRPNLMNLLGTDAPVQVPGTSVTADFFTVFGVSPVLGRTFREGEDAPGAAPVAVLAHGFWLQHFGGRPDVIGRRISINATHHEIVGVMPARFAFPNRHSQAFVTLRNRQDDGRDYRVVARLREGVSLGAAQGEMAGIATTIAAERPESNAGWRTLVVPLHEHLVGEIRRPLLLFGGAVTLVLLVACANVANLLLMRASARGRELSVRLALGAGRWRLIHQLIVESLLIAAIGAAVGVGIAWSTVRMFAALAPATLAFPRLEEISMDVRVLMCASGLSVLTALLCGGLPALLASRTRQGDDLPRGGRGYSMHHRSQTAMVIAEVALAVPLVIGAVLMAQSFFRISHVDPGFRTDNVLTVRMLLLPVRERSAHAEIVDDVLTRVRALPGVVAAGSIGRLPMDGGNSGSWYYRADLPEPAKSARPGGDISIVSPGYFSAMDIGVRQGRDFDRGDRLGAPHVGILNESAARMFFGGEPAVGRRLKVSWNDAREVEIVGVVGDIRHSQLKATPAPCLFLPHGQQPFPFVALVIRTAYSPQSLAAAVTREVHAADPDQGIGNIQTMDGLVSEAIAKPRAQTALLGAFAGVAMLLTCVGVYGVLAYAVAQRAREMGLRLALGATPRRVFAFVLRAGLTPVGVGLITGLGLAAAVTRFMEGVLFEVRPLDPVAFQVVTVLVLITGAAACAIPAARAMRVDPATVLRDE
jgi:predicted permease